MNERDMRSICQFCLQEQDNNSMKIPIDREIKQKFQDLTALKVKFV